MKRILIVGLIVLHHFGYGQERNNIWVIGDLPEFGNPDGMIDFNNGIPISDTLLNAKMPLAITIANICDTVGQLLFYTNGL